MPLVMLKTFSFTSRTRLRLLSLSLSLSLPVSVTFPGQRNVAACCTSHRDGSRDDATNRVNPLPGGNFRGVRDNVCRRRLCARRLSSGALNQSTRPIFVGRSAACETCRARDLSPSGVFSQDRSDNITKSLTHHYRREI